MSASVARLAGLTALALVMAAASAFAQTAGGNEAWIGQTGGTNLIDINQEGRSNAAGADNVLLRLDQDGDSNELTIDQYGWNNRVGAEMFEEPPRGVNQLGDRNVIDIRQRNFLDGGSNTIGAIHQRSDFLLSQTANRLEVLQTGVGDEPGAVSGAAGHVVGTVRQIHATPGSLPNVARIFQREGGLGLGNALSSLFQEGAGNLFEASQTGRSNQIGTVLQDGDDNFAVIFQDNDDNQLRDFRQLGDANRAEIEMSGVGNVIELILQNNELLGAAVDGNTIVVSIAGDANGAALDSVAGFVSEAANGVVAISQSVLEQIGDDNDIRLTIAGDDNRFGITQWGDDNTAFVDIGEEGGKLADENETAIFQYGDSNYVVHSVLGKQNVGAIEIAGSRNRALLSQRGMSNSAIVDIEGDGNNSQGNMLHGPALFVAGTLEPGDIRQRGSHNAVEMNVEGDRNNFAVRQIGYENHISALQSGTGHDLAVVQNGASHTSLSQQFGSGNSLGVQQF